MIRTKGSVISAIFISTLASLIHASTTTDIEKFKHSWLAQALELQRQIDMDVPLNKATFLATHNSYNSKAYQKPFRYLDPNHTLSIYNQLEAGARSVELDAHWTLADKFKKEILLCHARENHIGCSVFDRKIQEGLQEIRKWLLENPKEIVLLYIERHLDNHEPRMAYFLDSILGEFIYKPTEVRSKDDTEHFCVSLPTNISKSDVLKAGKQLIIVVKGCDGANPNYHERDKYPQIWNDFTFAGIADVSNAHYTFIEEMPAEFQGFPDCGKSDAFAFDTTHQSLWRIHEDRTFNGSIEHPQKKLDQYVMMEMVQCGINWQTMDMLKVADDRLLAAIWSWAPDYPKADGGNCAVYKRKSEGITNIDCTKVIASVACKNQVTQEIDAVLGAGTFTDANATCASKGNDWKFFTPVNGAEMSNIDEAAQRIGGPEVLLNYRRNSSGKWDVNL